MFLEAVRYFSILNSTSEFSLSEAWQYKALPQRTNTHNGWLINKHHMKKTKNTIIDHIIIEHAPIEYVY